MLHRISLERHASVSFWLIRALLFPMMLVCDNRLLPEHTCRTIDTVLSGPWNITQWKRCLRAESFKCGRVTLLLFFSWLPWKSKFESKVHYSSNRLNACVGAARALLMSLTSLPRSTPSGCSQQQLSGQHSPSLFARILPLTRSRSKTSCVRGQGA